LLHATEADRLDGVAAWVRRGLALGEKVVLTDGSLDPACLFAVLEARAVDGVAAARDGRLAVLSLDEFYPPEGQHVVVDRALAEGFPAVRISAEVPAALTGASPQAHRGFELRMNEMMRTRPVAAMCQYPRSTTTGARLRQTVAVHLAGVRESVLATGGDERGLVLRGEVDVTNSDVFTAVLAGASTTSSRVLCLDLAEVTYIDAGSCWRLDDATRRFPSAGGQVLLVDPQESVERTMRLLELDELPGIRLVGGEP
jgi:anti-anti-sigma factor